MNIKDSETERMAAELAERLNTGKTGAVRHALRTRLQELATIGGDRAQRQDAALFALRNEIWPHTQGAQPITKTDRQQILNPTPDTKK